MQRDISINLGYTRMVQCTLFSLQSGLMTNSVNEPCLPGDCSLELSISPFTSFSPTSSFSTQVLFRDAKSCAVAQKSHSVGYSIRCGTICFSSSVHYKKATVCYC